MVICSLKVTPPAATMCKNTQLQKVATNYALPLEAARGDSIVTRVVRGSNFFDPTQPNPQLNRTNKTTTNLLLKKTTLGT